MIRDLFEDICSPYASGMDRLIGVLLLILISLTAILVLGLAFLLIDEAGVKSHEVTSTSIVQKEYTPAHTTHGFIPAGKVIIPTTTHHPNRYTLYFDIEGNYTSINVSGEFFDVIRIGDRVEVQYGHRRISGSPIAHTISLNR